ncbi:MAG: hypothetical protein U0414_42925 [Polyangiaceae bacterium]
MVSHVSEALGRLDAAATFVEGVPSDGGARAMDLIAGVFRGKDVRVHSFEGTEALSELFHYEVTFTSPPSKMGLTPISSSAPRRRSTSSSSTLSLGSRRSSCSVAVKTARRA